MPMKTDYHAIPESIDELREQYVELAKNNMDMDMALSLITIIEPPIITAIEPMSTSGNTQLVSHFLFSCLPMQVYSEKYTSVL